jgi:hypothetical protein
VAGGRSLSTITAALRPLGWNSGRSAGTEKPFVQLESAAVFF